MVTCTRNIAPAALSRPDQKLSDGQFVSSLTNPSFLLPTSTNDGHGIRPNRPNTQSPLCRLRYPNRAKRCESLCRLPSEYDRYHRRNSKTIVRVLLQKLRTVLIPAFDMDDREAGIAGAARDLFKEAEGIE